MNLYVTLKGKEARACQSFAEASKIAQQFRDTADYGFAIGSEDYSRLRAGRIFDADTNKQIAHVSYNGRVWRGTAAKWTRDTEEIKENSLPETASTCGCNRCMACVEAGERQLREAGIGL